MAETTTPAYQPDPRLLYARATVANHLGLPLDNVTVKIDHEKDKDGFRPADLGIEQLLITIHAPGLDLERPRLTKEIQDALAQLKPLADNAQMVPESTLAPQLLEELKVATAGTNFNQKLLEWPGFNPKIITNGYEIGDYALQNVRDSSYGITMNLHFPHAPGENQAAAIERFTEITKGRIPALKEILLERINKYSRMNITERGLNEQEKQLAQAQATAAGKTPEEGVAQALEAKIQMAQTKASADIGKLNIALNIDHNNIVVTLRSPEQMEAYNKADPNERDGYSGQPNDVLRNTNPLTSRIIALSTQETMATATTPAIQPQLHKALARAILFDKEKHVAPDALQLFGRNDIKSALITEIVKRVLPKHPEKTEQLQKILNSELFKNHGSWHRDPGRVDVAKLPPEYRAPEGSNDTLEIQFSLKQDIDPAKNQLLQVVQGLAEITAQAAPAQPAQPQITPEQQQQLVEALMQTKWADQVGQSAQRPPIEKKQEGWLASITNSVARTFGMG